MVRRVEQTITNFIDTVARTNTLRTKDKRDEAKGVSWPELNISLKLHDDAINGEPPSLLRFYLVNLNRMNTTN